IILIFTIIEVFTLSIPTKLIDYISKSIIEVSSSFKKLDLQNLSIEHFQENSTLEVNNLKVQLSDSISKFRNMTVTAIKSKDYNTVKKSLDTIEDHIWGPII